MPPSLLAALPDQLARVLDGVPTAEQRRAFKVGRGEGEEAGETHARVASA